MLCLLEQEILKSVDCTVLGPVHTFKDASNLLANSSIDAALVDGTISGVSAAGFAAELTQNKIPFVILTAEGLYRPNGIPIAAFRDAIFVNKPFQDAQIIAAVEALLDRPA